MGRINLAVLLFLIVMPGFEGFLNQSAAFLTEEHKVLYKTSQEYQDFKFGNDYKSDCTYPRFWNGSGQRVLKGSNPEFDKLGGCYDSEFDQVSCGTADGTGPQHDLEAPQV